jgi:hypothetical protein
VLLVDADIIAYKVGFASEGEPLSYALSTAKRHIANLLSATGETDCRLYLTGGGNFREDISVTQIYKAKRGRKPTFHKEIREYLEKYHDAIVVEGMEADDMLSVALTESGGKDVLCTVDKDLLNTPGLHYNPMKPHMGVFDVSEQQATRHFYFQLLIGDPTDSIPGLKKGMGPARAKKILGDHNDELKLTFDKVSIAYKDEHADWTTYLIEQGRLLWMTRELNDDGTPVLWDIEYEHDRLARL